MDGKRLLSLLSLLSLRQIIFECVFIEIGSTVYAYRPPCFFYSTPVTIATIVTIAFGEK